MFNLFFAYPYWGLWISGVIFSLEFFNDDCHAPFFTYKSSQTTNSTLQVTQKIREKHNLTFEEYKMFIEGSRMKDKDDFYRIYGVSYYTFYAATKDRMNAYTNDIMGGPRYGNFKWFD